jgi:hypothetical protein
MHNMLRHAALFNKHFLHSSLLLNMLQVFFDKIDHITRMPQHGEISLEQVNMVKKILLLIQNNFITV